MQLSKNTLLQGGKYEIEKVLGQGGFGITYLATQELLDRKVCIKEFFFKDLCSRTCSGEVVLGTISNRDLVERFLNKFIKEARTLSQLDHSNIIRVLDIFKENNTAYYVMDFIEGSSLEDIVNSRGALSESVAIDYIKQVANALDYIHQRSVNHLDVKPANIMIRRNDNKAILIDFGVSKQYDSHGEQTSTTPVGISYGYAPIEQYRPGGVSEFSPQADIYALGATLYKLVTGKIPPQAIEIFNEGLSGLLNSLSFNLSNAIQKAMELKKSNRPQSIQKFLNILIVAKTNQKASSFAASKSSVNETTVLIKPTKLMNEINGHEYVDLGLPSGLKWAKCNVGANETTESGTYYGWRKISPLSANDSLDLITYEDNQIKVLTQLNEDIAHLMWGDNWRLPTNDEFEELKEECKWLWTKMLGQNGYRVIGPNGNNIFLPAVGRHDGDDYQKCGYYRTSDYEMDNRNLYEPKLHFKENEFGVRTIVYPFNNEQYWTDGYPVRAVMD